MDTQTLADLGPTEVLRDLLLTPDQDQVGIIGMFQKSQGGRDHDPRAMVSAHGIQGYGHSFYHGLTPSNGQRTRGRTTQSTYSAESTTLRPR